MINMLMLILAMGMLLMNLSAYRTFFESSETVTSRIKTSFDKQEDKNKAKGVAAITIMMSALIVIIFYIVSGSILSGVGMLFAAFMVLRTVYSTLKILKELGEEKFTKSNIGRILLPMVTVYLVYFILTYIKM